MQNPRALSLTCRLLVLAACACGSLAEPANDGSSGGDPRPGTGADSNQRVADPNQNIEIAATVILTLAPADVMAGSTHSVQAPMGTTVVLNLPTADLLGTGQISWTTQPTPPLAEIDAQANTAETADGQAIGVSSHLFATAGLAAGTYEVLAKFKVTLADGTSTEGEMTVSVVVTAAS